MPENPKDILPAQPDSQVKPPKEIVIPIVRLIDADPNNETHRTALLRMDRESLEDDGMLNTTTGEKTRLDDQEFKDWINCQSVHRLWLIQNPQQQFIGFVNSYADEHAEWVREQRLLPDIAIEELSSFVLNEFQQEGNPNQENQAMFQAISSIFFSEKNVVDAITVYVTHNDGNVLDEADTVFATQFGFQKVGTLRYPKDDEVDCTCFLLKKDDFIRAHTPVRQEPSPVGVGEPQ